jgi:hypothetical protein
MRDDFTLPTMQLLAKRVGFRCSNPDCRKPTSGPAADEASVNLGVAAHITAASAGGARFDPELTAEERRSPTNGIWLCQQCSRLVDVDDAGHTVSLLRDWKTFAEAAAAVELRGYSVRKGRDFLALERKLPELLAEMRADLKLKPFTREFIVLSRKVTYNPGPIPYFTYYLEDHDELLAKLQICEHFDAIYDAQRNNVPRWNFSEDFADYLLG